MTGAELQDIMETLLPESVLARVAEETSFHQRDRKRDAIKFLRTTLVSASSPAGGRQADIMRQYFETGAERIVRGSFYDWFGPTAREGEGRHQRVRARLRARPTGRPAGHAGRRSRLANRRP